MNSRKTLERRFLALAEDSLSVPVYHLHRIASLVGDLCHTVNYIEGHIYTVDSGLTTEYPGILDWAQNGI